MASSKKGPVRGLILAVHRRLLPDDPHIGWTPYLWLVYLSAMAMPWFSARASDWQRSLTLAGILVFLVLYFRGYWVRGRALLRTIAAIVVLAVILLPVNIGSFSFFIYASAFCGYLPPPRRGFAITLAIAAVMAIAFFAMGLPKQLLIYGIVFTVLVGTINIYYAELSRKNARLRLSQEETRQLAAMAERERIARDLHDLLGHTLSLIALKSELAAKLMDRDVGRAGEEIKDVERISREALKQVRDAVAGYRAAGLDGELANARLACEAMEIQMAYQPPKIRLRSECEAVLAMVVREAVTNIVRHAEANRCDVAFHESENQLVLEVRDNGKGGPVVEGNGLSGIRERLAEIGGSLRIQSDNGTLLHIRLPVAGVGVLEEKAGSISESPRIGSPSPPRLCRETGS